MKKLILLVGLLVIFLGVWTIFSPTFVQNKKNPQTLEKIKIVTEESVVTDIVEKVSPSVVTVSVEQHLVQLTPLDPFGLFKSPRDKGEREQNIGSGFIVAKDGLIVTNKHVVSTKNKYQVLDKDGKKYKVEKIYRDPANDVAILKITASNLKPVEMGDSTNLKVGQLVVAIGTPLGEFSGSVTKGIISGLGRGITTGSPFEGYVERLDNVIQTDAAINPGNSGGPLVNSGGQVIGINTAVASGAQNIGFAIPINLVREALDNFNRTGGFSRPYLGVSYKIITKELAVSQELPEGAYVVEVAPNQAADKAGVKAGDVITKIDGEKILANEGGLAKMIAGKKVGQSIKLTVWRNKKEIELTATLAETPQE